MVELNDLPPDSMRARESAPGEYKFFEVVQQYLDVAAEIIELPKYLRTILPQPKNEIIVHFPVKLDTGEVEILKATASSTTTF